MAEQVSSSVIGKVVDSLFGVIKKETSYMWNCKETVEKFKNEVEKLQDMKGRVQQQIDIAKRDGNYLVVGVEKWVEEAAQEISKAEAFLEQEAHAKKTCFKIGICGNWATLHRFGKMATKMTPSLLQLQERGKDFVARVSVETLAPGILDVYENKNLDDIVTQNSALNDIITALEDENIQIIGIYGLGGVGKTTLAKEVVAKVKHLFADVAFTTVSQTVKAEEIKKDVGNAMKRIAKGEKVLVILDDVWEKLDLEELCIPIKQKNCKIMLTSRSEKLCQKMNAQSKIYVDSLSNKEAWILFKSVAGERVETDAGLKPVAEEVAKECGGLPLLIQAVGNALKHESIDSWKAALSRLKKAAPSEIDPDIEKAFTRLQLSYEYLKSEEAKSCFLLCSMFPEDCNISLEALVYYMVGLHKFDELDSMEDARYRVRNAVNMLTSSCLLLNTQWKGCTKMHDVVRDVALLIARESKNKYLVKAGKGKDLTEWLPRDDSLKDYTGISLMDNTISKLPHYEVHLSSLDIFLVNNNPNLTMISDDFIKGMKEVKVLDLSKCVKTQLPQSLELLTKLRMLDLTGNKSLHEITMIGQMKELEILILNRTGIKEIPQEIGQLMSLRRLEVKDCVDLSRITQGVISGLWRLEELCIEFKLKFKGASNCIVEVMSLSKLTYLDLTFPSIDDIPAQGLGFNCEKMKEFVIQIGEYNRYPPTSRPISWSGRYLVLSKVHLKNSLVKRLKKLIEGSRPNTILYEVKNLNTMMPTLYDEGFNKLERIELNVCPDVSCLVDDGTMCDGDERKTEEKFFKELKHLELLNLNNLEVLWKCPDEYISLTSLVELDINWCRNLVRVFTVSVAQGLANLKYLEIEGCDRLEEVIRGGGGGDDESENVIVFPSLATIYLSHLPRLKRFMNSAGNCSIKYPSLIKVIIRSCESMEIWGPELHETPNLKTLVQSGDVPIVSNGGKIEEKFFKELKHLELKSLDKLEVLWKCADEYISLTNLVTLDIKYCHKLKRVFIVSVAQGLVNLKELKIKCCSSLEEVIWGGGGGDDECGDVIIFPSLATISLNVLPRLKRFFDSTGNCNIEYPSLVKVEIGPCESMEIWGHGIHETPKLETLVVDGDVPIVVDEWKTGVKFFKELKHLELRDITLEVLWKCRDEYISLTNLVKLEMVFCYRLARVFTVSVAQGLVNLKELEIRSCWSLKEVIGGGDGGDDESGHVIVFPSLCQISLRNLEKLKSFYSGGSENCSIKYPSLVKVLIRRCESMKTWGPGIHETPNLKSLVVESDDYHEPVIIPLDGPCAINEAMEKSRRK